MRPDTYDEPMPQDAALTKFASPVQELTPLPRPVCRECNEGHIRFDEPTEAEHGDSKEARSHPAWEPDWIKGTFTTSGRCENTNCAHTVAATVPPSSNPASAAAPCTSRRLVGRRFAHTAITAPPWSR